MEKIPAFSAILQCIQKHNEIHSSSNPLTLIHIELSLRAPYKHKPQESEKRRNRSQTATQQPLWSDDLVTRQGNLISLQQMRKSYKTQTIQCIQTTDFCFALNAVLSVALGGALLGYQLILKRTGFTENLLTSPAISIIREQNQSSWECSVCAPSTWRAWKY